MPQIEVTFDIDANGIMKISAKDKSTGKENKITIKSDSGLTEEEIEKMVRDAEANAEADKKQVELVNTKNQAEAQTHTIRKELDNHKDSLSDEDKTKIEAALKDIDEAVKNNDKEAIDKAVQSATESCKPLYEAMAKAQQTTEETPETKSGEDDVVDADFEEVKKDDDADKGSSN
jgi:molecular chaperone DnaK